MLVVSISCNVKHITDSNQKNPSKVDQDLDYSGPPTMIYKTKGNYKKLVPIELSADKTKIVSYPNPRDLYTNGELAYPTELSENYLLDNRAIRLNTAFLKVTYEEYKAYQEAPKVEDLYKMILDSDPFTSLCNCGNRYQYKNTNEINALVAEGLRRCKKLK